MPLDTSSPHVGNSDPLGLRHARTPWHPLNDTRLELALELLSQAGNGIAAASPVASAFARKFIKVLVLQKDDSESVFAAYSTQQYPGRAVISNPQLVDATQIAEAIVHEAIHALLYTLLQTYPWGIDDPLYDDKAKSNITMVGAESARKYFPPCVLSFGTGYCTFGVGLSQTRIFRRCGFAAGFRGARWAL